ncbi:MAG: aminotransferase class IV, partial [Gemmataceae bacterium]
MFGATVTDFCRTYRHRLFRWPDHLARLRRDAAACFIPLPYSDEELTAAAEHLVSENAKGLPPDDDLALTTFATPGPRDGHGSANRLAPDDAAALEGTCDPGELPGGEIFVA